MTDKQLFWFGSILNEKASILINVILYLISNIKKSFTVLLARMDR
jgi:hypothetical protein